MMRWIILFFITLLLSGCSSSGNKQSGLVYELDELKSAPETVKLGGNEYYVEAYLWRDLMPAIDPKDRTGLLANVKIIRTGGSPTDSVLVGHMWVINRDSVWASKPERVVDSQSNSVEFTCRNGPFWEAGIKVDVVILLQFKNQKKLLQSKEQKINAVY
jgi:uncharacterized lipoprotein YmbA